DRLERLRRPQPRTPWRPRRQPNLRRRTRRHAFPAGLASYFWRILHRILIWSSLHFLLRMSLLLSKRLNGRPLDIFSQFSRWSLPGRNRLLRAARSLVDRGVARASVRPDGNDDQGVGSAFSGDEGGPAGVAVRAEIGVGQIRGVEHHMRRKWRDDTFVLVDGHHVLRRQHVIDARPGWRLKDAFGERVGHEALDLFRALSLSAQLGYLQYAREKRTRALRIHALRLLTGGQ